MKEGKYDTLVQVYSLVRHICYTAPLYPSTGQQIRQDVPLIAGVFIPTVPLLFPVCTKHAGAVVSKHYQLRWLVVYQVDI
jgi:hypothetical protein